MGGKRIVEKGERPSARSNAFTVNVTAYKNNTPELKKISGDMFAALNDFFSTTSSEAQLREPPPSRDEFHLTSLHDNIIKTAKGFVFLPLPDFAHTNSESLTRVDAARQLFKAASLFVGMQTNDPDLKLYNEKGNAISQKPFIIYNKNNSWQPFFDLLDHLHEKGTVKQKWRQMIDVVNEDDPSEGISKIIHKLGAYAAEKIKREDPNKSLHHAAHSYTDAEIFDHQHIDRKPRDFNVCVFCSASTKDQELISLSKDLGRRIAEHNWGAITGLGSASMMGGVAEGAAEIIKTQNKGFVSGSNLSRIINMEGLPDYYDDIFLTKDIYTRMDMMIRESDAFIIAPGGMGSVQELLTLLMMKHVKENPPSKNKEKEYSMKGKPIIILNHKDADGHGFWDPLIDLLNKQGFAGDFIEANDVRQATTSLEEHVNKLKLSAIEKMHEHHLQSWQARREQQKIQLADATSLAM